MENGHKISFAPAASLIEFSPKGEFFGGKRGRIRDYRIIEQITFTGRNRLGVVVDLIESRRLLFDMRDSFRYRASFFVPYLLKSQVGKIKSFSVRSRSRLNRKIATVRKNHIPHFVTLTYHHDWPNDFEGFKYHLHHFCISLFNRFPNAGLIWKLEYQKRGAPHFHLFIWGCDLQELQDFVPEKWHNIVYKKLGFRSAYHLAWHKGELKDNEHCVQPIHSWNGVTSYAAKYFSKVDNELQGGRVWGVRGGHYEYKGRKVSGKFHEEFTSDGVKIQVPHEYVSHVPFSPILTFSVNLDVALDFRQRLAKSRNYEFQRLGFWCGDYSVDWLLLLDALQNYYFVSTHPPDDPPDWDLQEFPVRDYFEVAYA